MRIWPIVLMLFVMLGCSSERQSEKPSVAESGDNQAQQQNVVVPEKQAASPTSTVLTEKTTTETNPAAIMLKKHMTPAQVALGDPIVNSIGMVLIPVPAGEFQMGSPESDRAAQPVEKPQHLVKITEPFYLGAYEVTQQQYEKVMGARPWQGKDHVQEGPDHAATYVDWNNAVEFCRKLSEQEEGGYHLPTEAQWEYACRAGTTTAYSFGDDVSKLEEYAWYSKNSRKAEEKYAHSVGQKLPNPWGLFDMHGNVWEWCQDWYGDYGSEKTLTDPMGPAQGESRLLRGGAIGVLPDVVRSGYRNFFRPDFHDYFIGFRVVRKYDTSH